MFGPRQKTDFCTADSCHSIPRRCRSCSQTPSAWSPASSPWVRCRFHQRWCCSGLIPRRSPACSCGTCHQRWRLWVTAGHSGPTQCTPWVFGKDNKWYLIVFINIMQNQQHFCLFFQSWSVVYRSPAGALLLLRWHLSAQSNHRYRLYMRHLVVRWRSACTICDNMSVFSNKASFSALT